MARRRKKEEKKNDKPYILMKTVGALQKHEGVSREEAFRMATEALQALGLLRPGTHTLTRWGKDLERRMKISRALRKRK